MDSRDVSHVPPPDPAAFWPFTVGQVRLLSIKPRVTLELVKVEPTWRAYFRLSLDDVTVEDWLNIDRPCVALRMPETLEPAITFTLREVTARAGGVARLQVTAHPDLTLLAGSETVQ
jgi:hypothetical protein